MNQEPNLEELFSNYHPTLSDSDAFMQTLSRRLDAVQYVERYQAAQAARYRRYIVIALLVGLVLGGVSLAVILFLAPSAQFFTFRVQSDVLLLVQENSRLIAVLILSLLVSAALFFIFRYLIYLIRAATRVNKLRRLIEKSGPMDAPLKESDVHLTLPNTIFTLLGWLLYLVIAFSILHVPTKAITAIITGLAAGVGFALKDLINNFFYGLQLMAGRIKVGDKISCDGVRGIVKRISYQTTQVEDEDGSLIAFTNTELFTKKFRNLNSGRNYELLKIPVILSYGTDIETARKVILDAIQPLIITDKSGRKVVDPDFPIDIRVVEFTNNSVNLEVVLYTTVDRHYTFPARAKEMIYRAFREKGISFPFSQHDVYIKEPPVKK